METRYIVAYSISLLQFRDGTSICVKVLDCFDFIAFWCPKVAFDQFVVFQIDCDLITL